MRTHERGRVVCISGASDDQRELFISDRRASHFVRLSSIVKTWACHPGSVFSPEASRAVHFVRCPTSHLQQISTSTRRTWIRPPGRSRPDAGSGAESRVYTFPWTLLYRPQALQRRTRTMPVGQSLTLRKLSPTLTGRYRLTGCLARPS